LSRACTRPRSSRSRLKPVVFEVKVKAKAKAKANDHENTRSRQKQFYFSAQTEDRGQHSFGVVIIIYTVMKS